MQKCETSVEVTIDLNKIPTGVMRRSIEPWKDYDDNDVDSFLKYVGRKVQNCPSQNCTVVIYGVAPTEVAMRLGAYLHSITDNVVHSREFFGRKIVFQNGEVI
ncbi:MAG: hypothetical protein Q8J68_09365 [Methanolobus sp.]|uniref:hypothetical protein n=1 Tax=Methanolobus sp. TaxID=1874737 RepID=UPI002731AACB|nr:hypothetical protein [Methanolobus sp.]MDP2217482.1 hypothetical protein [Methanolobus sp.]